MTTPAITGHGYFTNQPYALRIGLDPNRAPGDAVEQASHVPVVHVGGRTRDAAATGTTVTLGQRTLGGLTPGTEVQVFTDAGAPVQLYTDATLAVPLGALGAPRIVAAGPSLTLFLPPGGYQLKHGGGSVSFEVA